MFCCRSKKCAEASVVDGALVISILSGTTPKIWRGDIKHRSSVTFEIDGTVLVMKSAEGGAESIATFAKKAEAEQALAAVSEALTCYGGRHSRGRHHKGGWFRKLLKAVLWLLAIFVLLGVLRAFLLPPAGPEMSSAPQQQAPQSTPLPGVPAPADQLIGK